MSNPVRQHYVPQTYLRNFAKKMDKTWHITVHDKKNRRSFNADIKDLAVIRNMYTIRGAEDPYKWERIFANKIEPLMTEVFHEMLVKASCALLNDDVVIIDSYLRDKLIDIIWSQIFRTPNGLTKLDNMASQILPNYLEGLKRGVLTRASAEQKELINSINLTDKMKMECMMNSSQNIPRGAHVKNLLNRMTWVIYRIPIDGKKTFHTGDHPVCIFHPSNKEKVLFEIGIADPETVIFYPINPQTLLAVYGVRHFHVVASRFNGRRCWLPLGSSDSFVELVNSIIKENCIKHVFSYPVDPLQKSGH